MSFAEKLRLDKATNQKLRQVGPALDTDWNDLVRRQLMPAGPDADDSLSTLAQNRSVKPRSTAGDGSRASVKSRGAREPASSHQLSAELLSLKSRLLVLDQIIEVRKKELETDNFRFFEENSEKKLEEIQSEIGGNKNWNLEEVEQQISIAEMTADRCKSTL